MTAQEDVLPLLDLLLEIDLHDARAVGGAHRAGQQGVVSGRHVLRLTDQGRGHPDEQDQDPGQEECELGCNLHFRNLHRELSCLG